jgi:hypothetical protein
VREVEHDAELGEALEQGAAETRQAAFLCGAVCERVTPVPRQPRDPQAELPEEVGRPDLVPERLDALEREDDLDPFVVEVVARAHDRNPVGVLSRRPVERCHLPQRLPERSFRLPVKVDEDRADLEPDVSCFEQR